MAVEDFIARLLSFENVVANQFVIFITPNDELLHEKKIIFKK